MRKHWLTLAVALVALLATGCAGSENGDAGPSPDNTDAAGETAEPTGDETGTASGESPLAVGLLASGPANDGGFVEAHYDGLLQAEEDHGIEINLSENNTEAEERAQNTRNLAQDNDLVIVLSFLGDAAAEIAQQFPDTDFMILDGTPDPSIPNLHAYRINQGKAAYIGGVIAAEMTESGSVGYIGAAEIPATVGSDVGFDLGVEATNPDVEVYSTFTGSFVDIALAKEAATAQISNDVDVIYTFLDHAIDGVVQAIEESDVDVKVFNITTPKCDVNEAFAGTDIVTPGKLMAQFVEDAMNDSLPAEKVEVGLEDPDIQDFVMCPGYEEYQEIVDQTTDDIVDGTIELPDTVV